MTDLAALDGGRANWRIASWDGGQLRIVAGSSIAYGHDHEIVVTDVAYFASPIEFHWPAFRGPTDEEVDVVRRALDGDLDGITLWCWDHDGGTGIVAGASLTSRPANAG